MEVFTMSHTGSPISESKLRELALDQESLRGYFSRTDISNLLANPTAVGIRVYNTIDIDQENYCAIAVAVKADGFELTNLYLKSQAAKSSNFKAMVEEEQRLNRQVARGDVAAGKEAAEAAKAAQVNNPNTVAKYEGFASFFSRTMIDGLLNNNTFHGICFYEVAIERFSDAILPAHISQESVKSSIFTHLAVSTNLNAGKVVGINFDIAFKNALCDIPCPGHCLSFTPQQQAEIAFTPSDNDGGFAEEPYLIKWD